MPICRNLPTKLQSGSKQTPIVNAILSPFTDEIAKWGQNDTILSPFTDEIANRVETPVVTFVDRCWLLPACRGFFFLPKFLK
jgi:hypothetical protein